MHVAPLYAARLENLIYGDTIGVECLRCRHKADVAVSAIRAKLPDSFKVLDLPQVLRCDKCRAKNPVVNARHALGYDQLDRR